MPGSLIKTYGGSSINVSKLVQGTPPVVVPPNPDPDPDPDPNPNPGSIIQFDKITGPYFQVLNNSLTTGQELGRWARSKGTDPNNPYQINNSDNMTIQSRMHRLWPFMKGVMIEFHWPDLEIALNVYDFSPIRVAIDQVRAITPGTNPRFLIAKIPTRAFTSSPTMLPGYLRNAKYKYNWNRALADRTNCPVNDRPSATAEATPIYEYAYLSTGGAEGSAANGTMQCDFTKDYLLERIFALHTALHQQLEEWGEIGKTLIMVTHSESATGSGQKPPFGVKITSGEDTGKVLNASIDQHRDARKKMYEGLKLCLPGRIVANDCQSPLSWCRDAFTTGWAKAKRVAMTGSNANWKSGLWRPAGSSPSQMGACRYYPLYKDDVVAFAQLQGDCFVDRPAFEDWSCTTIWADWMNNPDGGVVGNPVKACRPPTAQEILDHVRVDMQVHMFSIMFFSPLSNYSNWDPNDRAQRTKANRNNFGYYQVMQMMDHMKNNWTAQQAKLNQIPPKDENGNEIFV
jgi:hypothetical protein